MSLRILKINILNTFGPEHSLHLPQAGHLQHHQSEHVHQPVHHQAHLKFPPMKMVFSQPYPQPYSCHKQLLPLVVNLIEYVVALLHRLLVHLPLEVGGWVGGLGGAVELKQVANLKINMF